MEEASRPARKKGAVLKLVCILMTILIVVAIALYISYKAMAAKGKKSLTEDVDESEILSEELSDPEGEDAIEIPVERLREGWIRYDGSVYRYNSDIVSMLILGIDNKGKAVRQEGYFSGGQSDVIFVMVLNPDDGTAKVISVPRDTEAEVEELDADGRSVGTVMTQVCLAHGYGDGMEDSCERSLRSVSKLLYNIPLHGYYALNMGAIQQMNDLVGGVTVEVLEDLTNVSKRLVKGETVKLSGAEAYDYIHYRDTKQDMSAVGRLERQKQYLKAMTVELKAMVKKDIFSVIKMYQAISPYAVTNLSLDEITYMATNAAKYDFDPEENVETLTGKIEWDEEGFEIMRPDKEELRRIIIETFYEEVPEEELYK